MEKRGKGRLEGGNNGLLSVIGGPFKTLKIGTALTIIAVMRQSLCIFLQVVIILTMLETQR